MDLAERSADRIMEMIRNDETAEREEDRFGEAGIRLAIIRAVMGEKV